VSLGLVAGGRFPASELVPYWVAQVLGAVLGAAVLYVIASGSTSRRASRRTGTASTRRAATR
jgi:glycerol uptake facilitator-like aquaporin